MIDSHRRARERLAALREDLARQRDDRGPLAESARQQRVLAEQIRAAALAVANGWLGDPWDAIVPDDLRPDVGPVPDQGRACGPGARLYLRIGDIRTPEGAEGPMVVPMLGAMHLAIDSGVRDPAVAGLFQSVLTRLFAALPAGDLRVAAFDPASLGRVWEPFRPLVEAGVIVEHDTLDGALAEAEDQIRVLREKPDSPHQRLLLAVGGLPAAFGGEELARLLAVAHAGIAADVTMLVADWPPRMPGRQDPPVLDAAIQLTRNAPSARQPSARVPTWSAGTSGPGTSYNFPIVLDPAPAPGVMRRVCRPLAAQARAESALTFDSLLVNQVWTESSADGLATPIGRAGRSPLVVRFDDATPHWMVGGRSGSGKTNVLLDVLAGLTVRYAPRELAVYLLDFKEGVSFTEFTPTPRDPTWIPHAVAVGVESDREYGVAVLRALRAEMGRRASQMKRAGVTKLVDLRAASPDVDYPRVLAVIDEFQVMFAGNDSVARQATELLEEIARKGRSYGVHLVLASQTMSGIEALSTKIDAIFGQFPMRIALAGGGGVLDVLNREADGIPIGSAVVNTEGGIVGANTLVRVPYADPESMALLRHRLWERRPRGNRPPSVFVGYAPEHLEHDPTYLRLDTDRARRGVLLGRRIDVGSPTAIVDLDATPGRHLAVVGPSATGAEILYSAVVSLGAQHAPQTARFLLSPLAAAADAAAQAARDALNRDGHECRMVPLADLAATLAEVALFRDQTPQRPTYLALFGVDVAGPTLATVGTDTFRPGIVELQTIIQHGPVHGVHLLGWWRGLARLTQDLGPGSAEDIACVVALNVAENDLRDFVKRYDLHYQPRPNRALLLDRHAGTADLVVPFVRDGVFDEDEP